MAYFPFFVQLEGHAGLLVGGGRTALGKARRLLDYGSALTVVAPVILPELEALAGVACRHKVFGMEDLNGVPAFTFAVAATDDPAVNHAVSALCQARNIPVNVVDAPEDCTFLFPALVRRGPLSIGISTSGTSPSAAIHLKKEISHALPDHIGETLDWLGDQRETILHTVESEATRKAVFQTLFECCLQAGRPLTAEETRQVLKESPRWP